MPVPGDIGKRIKLGIFEVTASPKWVSVPSPEDKRGKQWIMGYTPKKGTDPNPLVLFQSDSFGFTGDAQKKALEKRFIEKMNIQNPSDFQRVNVAGHKTLVIRKFDGQDTAFTLLPYDDISFYLIVVLYSGKNVAALTPEVRSYLATMVIQGD